MNETRGSRGVRRGPRLLYVLARLGRRMLPDLVAERLLSRRFLPVEEVYRSCGYYLRGLVESGLIEEFRRTDPKTILEAGTGFYNPSTAPLLLSGGVRLILLEPYVEKNPDYDRLRRRFKGLFDLADRDERFPISKNFRPDFPVLESASWKGLPDGVELLQAHWEKTGLPDRSVDFVFSTSVLEHLRDPEAVLAECGRILKEDGKMIHVVDFRDHFFRYPLEMLKCSEKTWRLLTTRSGGSGYLNRWRPDRWNKALERFGFSVATLRVTDLLDRVRKERDSLAPEYRDLPDDDLRIGYGILVCRKATAEGGPSVAADAGV